MRDIEKAIEEGKKLAAQRARLDMNEKETRAIIEKFPDMYEAVMSAYWAGLAVGHRNGGK